MKKILVIYLICGLFFATTVLSQDCLDGYDKTTNAAIYGYNNKHLTGVTPEECACACDQETSFECKSFDYYKNSSACDLSSKSADDVGGLKTDYSGNPYDHYDRQNSSSDTNCDSSISARRLASDLNTANVLAIVTPLKGGAAITAPQIF